MVTYPSIPSAIQPLPHCEELPVPVFHGFASSEDADSEHEQEDYEGCLEEHQESSEDSSSDTQQSSAPQQFSHPELNNFVHDLGLSKQAAELLASRLQEKKSSRPVCKCFILLKMGPDVCELFSEDNHFVYCNNIAGLLSQLGITLYTPAAWRLFLDSSKRSLKCVLLHNGNVYGAVPVGHTVHLREECNDIKMVIDLLKYHEHKWIICVDLKIVNFLLGQQHGFTKFPWLSLHVGQPSSR